MKLSWTSPDQIPGIQRWGVLPLFFALAGAGGASGGAVLTEGLLGFKKAGESAWEWALIGGGPGLGIGFTILLCRSRGLRVLVAPGLTLLGTISALVLYDLSRGGPVRSRAQDIFDDPVWLALLVVHPVLMVMAHLLHLGNTSRSVPTGHALAAYGIAGILSGLGLVTLGSGWFTSLPGPAAILSGVSDGLCQLAAMAAAQACSGVPSPREGEAA